MSLQAIADFWTDPWVFTIPTLYVIAFFLIGLRIGYLTKGPALMAGLTAAGFLYALAWGLVQGPQPLRTIFDASGAGFNYTWASIFDAGLILLGIVAVYYSFTKFLRHPKTQWIGLALIGYHLGLTLHIALYRGKPLLDLFQ